MDLRHTDEQSSLFSKKTMSSAADVNTHCRQLDLGIHGSWLKMGARPEVWTTIGSGAGPWVHMCSTENRTVHMCWWRMDDPDALLEARVSTWD